MSIFLVIFLYATWSSIFTLGKWTLQFSSPLFLTSARMLLAGALLLGYLLVRKRKSFRLNWKQLLSISLLAFFSIYLTNICEFWGLQHLSAGKTCFIYSLSPFFAAFFSYLHFGEKMNKRKWLGMLIGFIGIIPVLLIQTGDEIAAGAMGFLSLPALAIIVAALSSVYGWVLLRLMVKDQEISPPMANGGSMVLGGLMALGHSASVEGIMPLPVSNVSAFFQGTLLMTFISNIICYNLYGYMLKKYTATFLSFMGLLSPVFASLTSWAILGESPSPLIFLCTGIVCFGLWLVYQAELKQGYIKKDKEAALQEAS